MTQQKLSLFKSLNSTPSRAVGFGWALMHMLLRMSGLIIIMTPIFDARNLAIKRL